MDMKLTEEQVAAGLTALDGWVRQDEKWISKGYRFASFMEGVGFVNQVADMSEAMNHHPMIAIDYRLVTLRLTSWHAGGLTELDLQAARAYDRIYDSIRNK